MKADAYVHLVELAFSFRHPRAYLVFVLRSIDHVVSIHSENLVDRNPVLSTYTAVRTCQSQNSVLEIPVFIHVFIRNATCLYFSSK